MADSFGPLRQRRAHDSEMFYLQSSFEAHLSIMATLLASSGDSIKKSGRFGGER